MPGNGRPAGRAGMRGRVDPARPSASPLGAGRSDGAWLVQAGDICGGSRLGGFRRVHCGRCDQRPDLVVWGKAASDKTTFAILTSWLAWPSSSASRRGFVINVDAPAPDGDLRSAVLVGAHEAVGSYRKTRLVP